MKLTKRQLKKIIREEKSKLLREMDMGGMDDYEKLVGSRRSQMSAPSADKHEVLMEQAVQACKDAGLTIEEILYLCENCV